MREILFRGRCSGGPWLYGSVLMYEDGYSEICVPYGDDALKKFRVDPETVGQFTGLTDKNGKKIFEGDILNIGGDAYSCCWDNCNFEFGVSSKKESFGLAYVASPCVEIIGNIHDNPELLGGADND